MNEDNPFDVQVKSVTRAEADSMSVLLATRWNGMDDEERLQAMGHLRPRLLYVLARWEQTDGRDMSDPSTVPETDEEVRKKFEASYSDLTWRGAVYGLYLVRRGQKDSVAQAYEFALKSACGHPTGDTAGFKRQ